jgi:hypothetical protein
MIDEPACAELGIAANVAVYPDQYGMPEALSGGPVDTTDPKTAFLDRVAEPASDGPVFLNRGCRVAVRGEALQKRLAMRLGPFRLVSPFVARIPRESHKAFLSLEVKGRIARDHVFLRPVIL